MPIAPDGSDDATLPAFTGKLLARFPQLQEIHLLPAQADGHLRGAPDWCLLLYAGYEEALPLLLALDRAQDEVRPPALNIYLFVEYYGGTCCGLWGGGLIHHAEMRQWREGVDYMFVAGRSEDGGGLARRIQEPEERRVGQRRQGERRRTPAATDTDQRRQDRRGPDRRRSG